MTARSLDEHAAFEEYLQRGLQGGWRQLPEHGQQRSPDHSLIDPAVELDSRLEHRELAEITTDWGDAVCRLAADLFFAPARWINAHYSVADHALFGLIEDLVGRFPPDDIDSRLEQSLERLLSRPFDDARMPLRIPPDHGALDLPSCVRLLKGLPLTSGRLDLMERLVRGDF